MNDEISWVGCPICGKQPNVSTLGTCIEIECCVSMSRVKSYYLTLEERETWDTKNHTFSDDIERKVINEVADEWNTRYE